MIDEISLKEFASGLIDIVKKSRCCIFVNFFQVEEKRKKRFSYFIQTMINPILKIINVVRKVHFQRACIQNSHAFLPKSRMRNRENN